MNEPTKTLNREALDTITDGYVNMIFLKERCYAHLWSGTNPVTPDQFQKWTETLAAIDVEMVATTNLFHYIVDNCPVK